ncbi:MAG: hypothetical protein BWK80_09690 [Desulfobacteraceae bacterium IS3]|nr:MAG: hypothetical protein BWK80_09690 [Desulfobacteraceae bacterium IS3]
MTISSDFYVTGGNVPLNAACYVERQADKDIYDALKKGQFCYVLNSRQMGKSSLMVRAARRLKEEGAAVIVIELTSIGMNLSPEQWYDGLTSKLGGQLSLEDELEDFWDEHQHLGPLHRWMEAIRRVVLSHCPGQVVIFIDEIDVTRSLPFSADEFFAAIRQCYNARTDDAEFERLTFCLIGAATPTDLIRDVRLTPFNIGERIEVNDFSESEAALLLAGLGREEKQAKALLKRILYWTNGHPYLTQKLCKAVAEDETIDRPAGVDRICETLFLSARSRESDHNLQFVRDRMLRGEEDTAALLDLYRQVRERKKIRDDDTQPLIAVLRLSGLVKSLENYLWVRNRIYVRAFDKNWINANMPDAEKRRQKAAYKRGVIRTIFMVAMIIALIGGGIFWYLDEKVYSLEEAIDNTNIRLTKIIHVGERDGNIFMDIELSIMNSNNIKIRLRNGIFAFSLHSEYYSNTNTFNTKGTIIKEDENKEIGIDKKNQTIYLKEKAENAVILHLNMGRSKEEAFKKLTHIISCIKEPSIKHPVIDVEGKFDLGFSMLLSKGWSEIENIRIEWQITPEIQDNTKVLFEKALQDFSEN